MESYKLAVVYLAYLEQQRNAAKEWPVAAGQESAASPLVRLRTVSHAAAVWLRGQKLQVRGQQRVRIAPPSPVLPTTSVAAGTSSSGT